MFKRLPILVATAVLGAGACTEPELVLPPPKPHLAPESATEKPAPTSGRRARAFLIDQESDLLPGVEANGKLGDLRIENAQAIFIIDGAGSALGFADSGGNIIDAAPAAGCGPRVCRDSLKQVFGELGGEFPRQPLYDLVRPGARGTSAVVHAVGRDSKDPSIAIETDYILDPDASALRIETRATNNGDKRASGYLVGDAVQWGRAERFVPGTGFGPAEAGVISAGYAVGLGDDETYVYASADPSGVRATHGGGWTDCVLCRGDLEPGGHLDCVRWLAVLPPSRSVGETVAALRQEKWPRLSGHVREEGTLKGLGGARVIAEDANGKPIALAVSDASEYALVAPPGDYLVRAEAVGRRGPAAVPATLRGDEMKSVDIFMSQSGSLRYRVTEGGKPSPAKLSFFGGERAVHLGPAFATPGGNAAHTATGEGEVKLAPGRYEVIASRGPEFTIDKKTIEIPDGGQAQVELTLSRAVDARGLLCVDLHQHAMGSPDSGVSLVDRAVANLAEGLDVMVPTDHNAIADWRPALEALKTARPLRIVLGEEATLDGLGHWNAYPVTYRKEAPRGGALDVRGLDAHQIVGGLRGSGGERVVQVNHPRFRNIGYFNTVHLDAAAPSLPADWEGGFDAIEVFSANDSAAAEVVMRDWFALLDRGFEYTAVGGSDSHLMNGNEVGYPRTCVNLSDPPAPDLGAALVDGIKRRRDAFVTNGPYLRVQVGGRGMGQVAAAARGRARVDIEVSAAPWVDARHVEVLVNGARRGRPVDLPPPPPGQSLKWKGSIDVKVTEDAYVVVVVRGEQPLPILRASHGRRPVPFALSNPIFLDRDLDGRYTAPRLKP